MMLLLLIFMPAVVAVGLMYLTLILSAAIVAAGDRFVRWK